MPSLDFFTLIPIKYLAIKTIEDTELEKKANAATHKGVTFLPYMCPVSHGTMYQISPTPKCM
jgi:hypothetical protein